MWVVGSRIGAVEGGGVWVGAGGSESGPPTACSPTVPLTLPKGMEFTKKRLSFSLRKRGCSFSFTMKMMSAGMMLGPWVGEAKE